VIRMSEGKISRDLEKEISEMDPMQEISVVIKLGELNDEVLAELSEIGRIEMVIRLTRHVQLRIRVKDIATLLAKEYIVFIDKLRVMRVT